MRPNLKDVIALVKNTSKPVVYFSIQEGIFRLTINPVPNCVEVSIGSNIRKSVKKGLDNLEAQSIESRKSARATIKSGSGDSAEGDGPDSD